MTSQDQLEASTSSVSTVEKTEDICNGSESSHESVENASFDIPRPILTIQQAAAFLGKSVRALERSLVGRWGNKLPEGWTARKVKTERGEEWRIVPPPGFRVRSHSRTSEFAVNSGSDKLADSQLEQPFEAPALMKRSPGREHSLEQPTIIIDRSEEVEQLLRELLVTQKALSEERRLHMEDLRIITHLQGSLRLLESSASESAKVRSDLEAARKELETAKEEYNSLLRLPWWKRVFGFGKR